MPATREQFEHKNPHPKKAAGEGGSTQIKGLGYLYKRQSHERPKEKRAEQFLRDWEWGGGEIGDKTSRKGKKTCIKEKKDQTYPMKSDPPKKSEKKRRHLGGGGVAKNRRNKIKKKHKIVFGGWGG